MGLRVVISGLAGERNKRKRADGEVNAYEAFIAIPNGRSYTLGDKKP